MVEGDYLLNEIQITIDNKDIKANEIRPYVKQKPNSKFAGVFKLRLWIYNRASKNKDGKLSNGFRKVGEAPVIYDNNASIQSRKEMERFLYNKGFNAPTITSTSHFNEKRKKVSVDYDITCNKPLRIASAQYDVKDSTIRNIISESASGSLIKSGNRFDLDVLDEERERLTKLLKDEGYYNFNKNNFYFEVDTNIGNYMVNETMVLDVDTARPERSYIPMRINTLRFVVGYETEKALNLGDAYMDSMMVSNYRGIDFLSEGEPKVKPEILYRNNLLKSGMLYSKSLSDRTHSMLSAIGIIRFVNMNYTVVNDSLLNCDIYITLTSSQSTTLNIEGTNVSANLGAAASLNYAHKNLLRGAEQLSTNFRVGVEAIVGTDKNRIGYSKELGADIKLTYPKFMFPFLEEDFKQKSRAQTNYLLSYDLQQRPEYERQIATAEFSYSWRSHSQVKQELTPLMMNYINIPTMTDKFRTHIDSTEYLKYSYEDHVILGSRYSITFQGKKDNKKESRYLRFMAESSGNVLNLANEALGRDQKQLYDDSGNLDESYYSFLGVRYSQYLKFDATGVFSHHLNSSNAFAYRAQLGLGVPYGNTSQLPFEKRYFGGGANGVRAWMIRSLGPGTYYNDEVDYMNQSGDISFIASAEYRFHLFWILEGALFADVGNTWTIREYEKQPGAVFEFDTFYKQLAAGVGTGIRLDLNIFVFRVDLGFKAFDPTQEYKQRWVLGDDWKQPTTHIAIGYPF